MRLLLVLSAFLTALVGLGAVPASARAASEVCASASVKSERQALRIAAVSAPKVYVQDRASFGPLPMTTAPVRSVPLYVERLRV